MQIRLAEADDIQQLIQMRWDFTIEHDESKKSTSFQEFETECRSFLERALLNQQWFIWIAEEQGKILSHIYIECIHKVPRPGRITYPFAYMTNVYTLPEYRQKGIGSKLLHVIHDWTKENKYEFVLVWPSDEAIEFYKRSGYEVLTEPLIYYPK
ncbi:GNAT family N-acetyltransferase [Bacillus mesophilum]|uniref:GNAT family N-acetyltransferase n=1 Tax=Bacillus mesophilum TaxID=1071718 RepID=A0A7V7UUF0_9BACI|nr:GNAT family N-acetyltransferase [Bacillus mesophilum]KAB2331066.1 GNAT family N-acetyltransferase [Bacillus mesophilum]